MVGSAATLSAFGGKTWNEGKEPILKRITARGWVSLICLALALLLGVVKEITTKRAEDKQRRDADAEKIKAVEQANKNQKALEEQLTSTKSELGNANQRLTDLKTIAELSQGRLLDSQSTLSNVRMDLNETRDVLSQQSSVNLMTVLANTDEKLSTVEVIVPFTKKANPDFTVGKILVPWTNSADCETFRYPRIAILNGSRGRYTYSTTEIYNSDDNEDSHDNFKFVGTPMADMLLHPRNQTKRRNVWITEGDLLSLAGQHSSNGRIFVAELHPEDPVSAAEFINDLLTHEAAYPITIELSGDYDKRCLSDVKRYYRSAFEKAYFGIILAQRQNIRVFFRLKAMSPFIQDNSVEERFKLVSPALILIRADLRDFLKIEWPARTAKSTGK